MKKLFYLLLLASAACHNNEVSEPGASAIASEEDQLISTVKSFPDSTLAVENLVQYYREQGETEKAIHTVDDAIKRDSTKARYWHINGVLHYENADTATAISLLEKSISISKDLSDVLLVAKIYAENRNTTALELADALIQKKEFVKEATFIKGIYFKNIHQDDKAIGYFDEAIGMSYTFIEPYIQKADVFYQQQNYMESLKILEKAIKVQNNNAEAYFYMGRSFEKLNRLEDAKECYGTALIYQQDFDEARAALDSIESRNKTGLQ